MTSKAHINHEELREIIANIKANGGDATELEAMTASQGVTKRVAMKMPAEQDETPAQRYWRLFHELTEHPELPPAAKAIMENIQTTTGPGGKWYVNPDQAHQVERHCVVLSQIGNCPWSDLPCTCVETRGFCKKRLFLPLPEN